MPLRRTIYPITPTLSVDGFHDRLTANATAAAEAVRLAGVEGRVVSPLPVLAVVALVALLLAGRPRAYSQVITPQTVLPLIDGNSASLLYTWSAALGIGSVTDCFEVQNGVLHVVGNEVGALISTNQYRDYVLVLEYKLGTQQWGNAVGAAKNTGILIHSRGYVAATTTATCPDSRCNWPRAAPGISSSKWATMSLASRFR